MLTLSFDHLRVRVDPARGAGVTAFDVDMDGQWLPIYAQAAELPVASFLMVPWSNRVADGRFVHAGTAIQLDEPDRHAIHGLVRKRPWAIVHATTSEATLRYTWPGGAWPWPFEAEVHYWLADHTFHSALAVTNRGDSPMPAGLGFHPYFTRGDVIIGFHVAGIYPDAHGTRIPSGPAAPLDPPRDHTIARPLDPDTFMDFCGHGWDGVATLRWPAAGLVVDVRSDLDHLVFYNPPQPYFALEPVSNANDGFNLRTRGDPTHGVRVLAPGETLRGHMALRARVRVRG